MVDNLEFPLYYALVDQVSDTLYCHMRENPLPCVEDMIIGSDLYYVVHRSLDDRFSELKSREIWRQRRSNVVDPLMVDVDAWVP